MKELLFRAYDPHLEKMICTGFSIIGEVTVFSGLEVNIQETPIEDVSSLERLLNLKITQYTGLEDVHKQKIYAGDILKETKFYSLLRYYQVFNVKGGFAINTHQDDFKKSPDQILFYESLADMQTSSWIESSVEVIGNVFENKELLK